MTVLHPTRVGTERFTYDPTQNMFVAEASDLPALGRVYDDACDVGLTLVSHKTGREIVFVVAREERDPEGELLYTDLKPASPSLWAAGTVRIFND